MEGPLSEKHTGIVSGKLFSTGETVNPDTYGTCSDDIVKKLPKRNFVKDRLTFPTNDV